MTGVDDGPLRLLLQLHGSSRYTVDACSAAAGPYVLVRCPGGLSLIAAEVEALDGLASVVMDARAALLALMDEAWRCEADTPDEVQRRYNSLGIGRQDVTGWGKWQRLVPVDLLADGREWLTAEETPAALGIRVATLTTAWVTNGVGPTRHRIDGEIVYRRAEVIAVREQRRVA